MKTIEVHLVNAFTAFDEGGNPAGVVLNADSLCIEEKLKVAQAVGYSETAFVSKDEYADVALSFFTVTGEVDFCGHATLAAFSLMFKKGILPAGDYTQRTKAGMLGVSITGEGNVVMGQKSPEFTQRLTYEEVSELIGIAPDILASTHLPIEVVSTGLPDIIVALPTGYLSKISLNKDKTTEFCRQHNAVGIHAFELSESSSNLTASCRNFAPLLGIAEESATGSASGALACYLAKYCIGDIGIKKNGSTASSSENCSKHRRTLTKKNSTFNFVFEQGRAMGCVSRILATVAIKDSKNTQWEVSVAGLASTIGKKAIVLRSPSI
ncbi:PhzF family phenazine biosynthesis protein [Alteromonas sp. BMJM2]|uniref:PhzF family phenazine biosynthesis protein n=1 Tax=Alteromonas sp. BMJM2 TaxID=2954241 RepID=UPI0022B3AEB4|nr:PhzF family phenazine biosynthesis protein [Alteromonas sp. BMJM2]